MLKTCKLRSSVLLGTHTLLDTSLKQLQSLIYLPKLTSNV